MESVMINQVVGLSDAEGDAEKISEEIKTKLDPVPVVNLEYKEIDGKELILLHVYPGRKHHITILETSSDWPLCA